MVTLSPRVTRVRAGNPSPMTLTGTNTYLIELGAGDCAVVDPGPANDAHIDAIVTAASTSKRRIAAILVTHGHPDHFPGAAPLAQRSGAPVWAHANARFPHDRALADGERLRFADATIEVIDAPGHTFDHLVFALTDEAALFTGDVVIGSGFVVIAPPGGAMRPYQRTLARLQRDHANARAIYGGHGEAVDDPRAKLAEYAEHRQAREKQLIATLEGGPATIPALVETIYAATDRRLWPAAARQLLAYLLALEAETRVTQSAVERGATPLEREILQPNLSRIVDAEQAAVARAELGIDEAAPLVEYRLS